MLVLRDVPWEKLAVMAVGTLGYVFVALFSSDISVLPSLLGPRSKTVGSIVTIVMDGIAMMSIIFLYWKNCNRKPALESFDSLCKRFPFYFAYCLCLSVLWSKGTLEQEADFHVLDVTEMILNTVWGFLILFYTAIKVTDTRSVPYLTILNWSGIKLVRFMSFDLLNYKQLKFMTDHLNEKQQFVARFIVAFTADFLLIALDVLLFKRGAETSHQQLIELSETATPSGEPQQRIGRQIAHGPSRGGRGSGQALEDGEPQQQVDRQMADGSSRGAPGKGQAPEDGGAQQRIQTTDGSAQGARGMGQAPVLLPQLKYFMPVGLALIFPSPLLFLYAIHKAPQECSVSYFTGAFLGGGIALICFGKLANKWWTGENRNTEQNHSCSRWKQLGVSSFVFYTTAGVNLMGNLSLLCSAIVNVCSPAIVYLSISTLSTLSVILYVWWYGINKTTWSRSFDLCVALLQAYWLIADGVAEATEMKSIKQDWLQHFWISCMPLTIVFRLYCAMVFLRYAQFSQQDMLPSRLPHIDGKNIAATVGL